jgi:tripartite-type tricarboxylate transporter receptor subunit TctC
MLTRRSFVAAGLFAPALAPVAAGAQPSSSALVRIINPFAAGGTSDAMARMLQPSLQQRQGATIIVENRPGASASIGAGIVAKSPPDGTTWLLTSDTFVVSTLLLNNLPYDVQKDFAPVTMIARGPMVLCAHPSRPYRTLPELVAAAKARPAALTYGTTGIGRQVITSLHAYSWFGFFGPAGTPKPIIDRFYRDVAATVREEANYNTLVTKFRCEVPLPTPDELRQMIVEELPFWAKIIHDNNIKGGA